MSARHLHEEIENLYHEARYNHPTALALLALPVASVLLALALVASPFIIGYALYRLYQWAMTAPQTAAVRAVARRAGRRVSRDVGHTFAPRQEFAPKCRREMPAIDAAGWVAALTCCGVLAAAAFCNPVPALVIASPFLLVLLFALTDAHASAAIGRAVVNPVVDAVFSRPTTPREPLTAGVSLEPVYPWAIPVHPYRGEAGRYAARAAARSCCAA